MAVVSDRVDWPEHLRPSPVASAARFTRSRLLSSQSRPRGPLNPPANFILACAPPGPTPDSQRPSDSHPSSSRRQHLRLSRKGSAGKLGVEPPPLESAFLLQAAVSGTAASSDPPYDGRDAPQLRTKLDAPRLRRRGVQRPVRETQKNNDADVSTLMGAFATSGLMPKSSKTPLLERMSSAVSERPVSSLDGAATLLLPRPPSPAVPPTATAPPEHAGASLRSSLELRHVAASPQRLTDAMKMIDQELKEELKVPIADPISLENATERPAETAIQHREDHAPEKARRKNVPVWSVAGVSYHAGDRGPLPRADSDGSQHTLAPSEQQFISNTNVRQAHGAQLVCDLGAYTTAEDWASGAEVDVPAGRLEGVDPVDDFWELVVDNQEEKLVDLVMDMMRSRVITTVRQHVPLMKRTIQSRIATARLQSELQYLRKLQRESEVELDGVKDQEQSDEDNETLMYQTSEAPPNNDTDTVAQEEATDSAGVLSAPRSSLRSSLRSSRRATESTASGQSETHTDDTQLQLPRIERASTGSNAGSSALEEHGQDRHTAQTSRTVSFADDTPSFPPISRSADPPRRTRNRPSPNVDADADAEAEAAALRELRALTHSAAKYDVFAARMLDTVAKTTTRAVPNALLANLRSLLPQQEITEIVSHGQLARRAMESATQNEAVDDPELDNKSVPGASEGKRYARGLGQYGGRTAGVRVAGERHWRWNKEASTTADDPQFSVTGAAVNGGGESARERVLDPVDAADVGCASDSQSDDRRFNEMDEYMRTVLSMMGVQPFVVSLQPLIAAMAGKSTIEEAHEEAEEEEEEDMEEERKQPRVEITTVDEQFSGESLSSTDDAEAEDRDSAEQSEEEYDEAQLDSHEPTNYAATGIQLPDMAVGQEARVAAQFMMSALRRRWARKGTSSKSTAPSAHLAWSQHLRTLGIGPSRPKRRRRRRNNTRRARLAEDLANLGPNLFKTTTALEDVAANTGKTVTRATLSKRHARRSSVMSDGAIRNWEVMASMEEELASQKRAFERERLKWHRAQVRKDTRDLHRQQRAQRRAKRRALENLRKEVAKLPSLLDSLPNCSSFLRMWESQKESSFVPLDTSKSKHARTVSLLDYTPQRINAPEAAARKPLSPVQ